MNEEIMSSNPSTAASGISKPEVRDKLIVALDFAKAESALSLVDHLDGASRWFKVGLELYLAEGNAIVAELRRRGFSVFLDLKLHDIPNTVVAAVRSAADLGVAMLTVHAAGGPSMLKAAAEAASQAAGSLTLLAVTVLTSMDAAELSATGVDSQPAAQVERLAALAFSSGIRGVVASAEETAMLRRQLGKDAVLVIPGIRPGGGAADDQKRVATPGDAIAAGASYLVVGRPITRAPDPARAAREIIREIESASA